MPQNENNEYSEVPTEDLDDETEEDETVFVKDPTIHLKPLMHPKRRKKTVQQVTGRSRPCCTHRRHSSLLTCVFVLALVILIPFLLIYIYRNTLSSLVTKLGRHGTQAFAKRTGNHSGCDDIEVHEVWSSRFPVLISESAARLVDVNDDGILDVIIGFGTGVDSYTTSRIKCDIYFGGDYPCFGGLLALDGKDGRELWRGYDKHEVFAVNCQVDLNEDGYVDCIGAGRGATFSAFDSRTGALIWQYRGAIGKMNFYTPQAIEDIDSDGVPEFVQIHGGDPIFNPEEQERPVAYLLIVSGRTGQLILSHEVPDRFESYYSPQIISTGSDGGDLAILFGTGGETHAGSLYLIKLRHLLETATGVSRLNPFARLYSDKHKGVTTPPVLADITNDGVEDIIMSMFNSTVVAFDGRPPYNILWKFSMPQPAESYNTPAIGYFNDDSVPDIAIQYSVGPGYPIYFYSEVLILDGKNGKVIARPSLSNTGIQASPLTISFKDSGDDIFLFWSQQCRGYENEKRQHKFSAIFTQAQQSRAHLCKIKFNTTTITRYVVKGRVHPETNLYNSEARFHHEHRMVFNASQKAWEFVQRHNRYFGEYQKYSQSLRMQEESHRRIKRHVGPHDSEGLQRAISTGTLAPPFSEKPSDDNVMRSSMDVIFSTYWSKPSEANLMNPQEEECVSTWLQYEKQRFERNNEFYGMDHDHYLGVVQRMCHRKYGDRASRQNQFNIFDIHVGQLTVYRQRITCVCKRAPGKRCPAILPHASQGWAAYLGTFGNSHWNKKAKHS